MNAVSMPLDPVGNAAVIIMLLDDGLATGILSQLDPTELQRLGQKMCALGEIGTEAITGAITGFVERTENLGITAHDRADKVRSMMVRAVGGVKAESLMERILPPAAPRQSRIEIARWLTPGAIVPLITGEHPQAIAVLLVQLDPEVSAAVLHGLPQDAQSEIVRRIATLGPVSPLAISMLEELLSRRIEECHGSRALAFGGPREAAGIINGSDKSVEQRVIAGIVQRDETLAREIEEEMFRFEHLYGLDVQSMGSLLREVESDTLIGALKGISEEARLPFFAAMSSRAADGVKDEIEARGRMKMAEVQAAQKEIVAAARRLATDGVIAFGSGSGDDYV